MGVDLGIPTHKISAQSLRVGGAMVILLNNIDPNRISLIVRWCSYKMICYISVTAHLLMHGYAAMMVAAGGYTLIPTVNLFSFMG